MNICFNARPSYDRVSPLIFQKLQSRHPSWKGTFVVCNTSEKQSVCSVIPDADVRIMADFTQSRWNDFSESLLADFEKKYNCCPIWKYIYMDRFLVNCSREDIIRHVCAMFAFYTEIFVKGNYDFYFDETIATAQSYIAYFVGRHFGAKYISLMAARGCELTHHYVVTDPTQHQFGFNENYKSKEYSPEIMKFAKEVFDKYNSNYSKPASMTMVKSKPSLDFRLLVRFMVRYLKHENHNRYDLINYRSYLREFDQFCFFFRYLKCRKYYTKKIPQGKYVYFPLHYQPEASTLVCAPKYEKQIFYIDSWAKSVPADTVLIVKEHYALVGHRPLSFYKEMKKYPNAVMISPWYPSVNLIKHAEAITTLTGTAGWEAMILGRPVYLGGEIYFDNAPGVYDASEAFGIYNGALRGASEVEVLDYLCEYVSNIYPGAVYFSVNKYLLDDNIELICNSLENAFGIIQKQSDK